MHEQQMQALEALETEALDALDILDALEACELERVEMDMDMRFRSERTGRLCDFSFE